MKRLSMISLVLIFCFFSFTNNNAQWADKSDDLPSDGVNPLTIASLVICAGCIVYLIVHNSGEDEPEDTGKTIIDSTESASLNAELNIVTNAKKNIYELESLIALPESNSSAELPFNLNFDIIPPKGQYNEFTYKIGVGINL